MSSFKSPKILDCTLRDGSYVIKFQFTAEDTRDISEALDELGFPYIEVGHGIGLGASENTQWVAAESDEDYMKAASEAVKVNQWGMFCIPGIAELDSIDMAADYGMGFVRVGTNIDEADTAEPFIKKARDKGMFVCANFMKSYACTPEEFCRYAKMAHEYGAEVVYIVDSAGGMLPEEIAAYFAVLKAEVPEIEIGFHGHDNLGLGVANGLKAAELGAAIVDSSLQGFGRSAGNTATEQFICALMRSGVNPGIDPIDVMQVGEKHVRPRIEARGSSSIDTVSGLALFHSSYMPIVEEMATKHRVDVRRLIVSLCERNKMDAPRELVEEVASKLSEQHFHAPTLIYEHYFGDEQHKHAK